MNKLAVLIETSRPVLWMVLPLIFITGMLASGSRFTTLSSIQLFLLSFPFCVLLYGINDVYDYDSDKLNPRKNILEGISLKPKYHSFVKRASFIVIVILLGSSFLTFNPTNIMAMSLLLFFSYSYSAPPLRFKEKPPMDSISNGIIYFLSPLLLGFSFGKQIFDLSFVWYLITICAMGVHAYTTIMDYTFDKKAGHKTFSIIFGKRTAAFLPFVLFIVTFFFTNFSLPTKIYIIFCSFLFLITSFYPSEKLATFFVKLIFIGFIINRIAVFMISNL